MHAPSLEIQQKVALKSKSSATPRRSCTAMTRVGMAAPACMVGAAVDPTKREVGHGAL
jgi:hypothetical protein